MPTKYASKPTAEQPKPETLDLLALVRARVDGTTAQRQPVRTRVCLRPELFADLIDANTAYAATADGSAAEGAAKAEVERLEAEVKASSIRVRLMPLTPKADIALLDKLKAEADADDVSQDVLYRARIKAVFESASSLDGEPLDLDAETFGQLVDVMSAGELTQTHRLLMDAQSEPAFPQ